MRPVFSEGPGPLYKVCPAKIDSQETCLDKLVKLVCKSLFSKRLFVKLAKKCSFYNKSCLMEESYKCTSGAVSFVSLEPYVC